MTDFAQRRIVMVDTQVRPNDVTKFPVIEAMLSVPREAFVPAERREVAYVGENVDLGHGRIMVEPRTLAKMLDALDVGLQDHVLVVAGGLGYSAAVLARMVKSVVVVETPEFAEGARSVLAGQDIGNVSVVAGPPAGGAAAEGPYDAILVEGGVEAVPEALLAQLRDGGRIGCIFMDGALGICRIGYRGEGGVSWRFAFNAAVPVLPGFEMRKSFAL